MSPRFVLRRENVPCVAEVVNRSLKADCTDFTRQSPYRLTYPEFPFKSEAKGDNLIGVHQTKVVKL